MSGRHYREDTGDLEGLVTLNGDVVGKFEMDENDNIAVTVSASKVGIRELLEYATDQGMSLGLILSPRLEE